MSAQCHDLVTSGGLVLHIGARFRVWLVVCFATRRARRTSGLFGLIGLWDMLTALCAAGYCLLFSLCRSFLSVCDAGLDGPVGFLGLEAACCSGGAERFHGSGH